MNDEAKKNEKEKFEIKRRGFLSLAIMALVSPSVTKASSKSIPGAKKIEKVKGKIVLPKDPVPFQTIVELCGKRSQRIFSRTLVVPGENKINGRSGNISIHEIYKTAQGPKIFLQYTGDDLGWITLA